MEAGEWLVQVNPAAGTPLQKPVNFPDFSATLAFVKTFKECGSKDTLRVHAPARMTHIERQELIIANGAYPF